jgi:mRNA interferase RelE/StbE
MSYSLEFLESADKEWRKLNSTVRDQFKKKLAERLVNPRVPASQLRGSKDRYKIKLRDAGYRLVYEVADEVLLVTVIAVGKRERGSVYEAARKR